MGAVGAAAGGLGAIVGRGAGYWKEGVDRKGFEPTPEVGIHDED